MSKAELRYRIALTRYQEHLRSSKYQEAAP